MSHNSNKKTKNSQEKNNIVYGKSIGTSISDDGSEVTIYKNSAVTKKPGEIAISLPEGETISESTMLFINSLVSNKKK